MDKLIPIKCGNVNCYIICGDTASVLVDTGREKYKGYLLKCVKSYNIKLIVLTHGHIDHIANTKFLSQQLNAKIAMHKFDYELSKDNSIRTIYSRSLRGRILKNVSEKDFRKIKPVDFEPDIFVEDKQSLRDYGVNAKIYTLPGHTKGSIGILINNKDLIAGDTIMNIMFPSSSLIAEDFKNLDKSIEKIKELNIQTIYVGHGKPINASNFFKV